MGAITDAEARRLLAAYLPIVYALAPLHPGLDPAQLRAAGEDAILEAALTLDAERANEGTWVRRVIHWRLAEASHPDEPLERLDPDPQVVNGRDPELALLQATAVHLIGRLSIRHQMVVDGRMRGETYEEIAEQIGVSSQRVHAEAVKAFRLLRSMLEDEV